MVSSAPASMPESFTQSIKQPVSLSNVKVTFSEGSHLWLKREDMANMPASSPPMAKLGGIYEHPITCINLIMYSPICSPDGFKEAHLSSESSVCVQAMNHAACFLIEHFESFRDSAEFGPEQRFFSQYHVSGAQSLAGEDSVA